MIVFPSTISGLRRDEQDLYRKLLRRLYKKRKRNRLRSTYYNGRNELHDIGYSLPPIAKDIDIVVGWPEKAVEGLANRVRLDGVLPDEGTELSATVDHLLEDNDLAQMAQSVHTDAFVHSCSFVAVLAGDTSIGEPEAILQEFTADTATGEWDKRRKRLKTALLFETDDSSENITAAYLMTYEQTITIIPTGDGWHVSERYVDGSGRIPCELFAFKPDSKRHFGRSRISRTVMSLTDSAVRTFTRSEMQAELYSVPPRYFLNADESIFTDDDGNLIPKWKVLLDQTLVLPYNERVDKQVEVGQFQQASFEPHVAQLRQTATMFASATSLPPDAMGVLTDNPSSAEAIDKATKELCLLAEECHVWFGKPWERIIARAQLAAGTDGDLQAVHPLWRNPSTPSKAAAADLALKLVQGKVLQPDSEVTYDMLDFTDQQRRTLRGEQRRRQAREYIASLTNGAQNVSQQSGPASANGSGSGTGDQRSS